MAEPILTYVFGTSNDGTVLVDEETLSLGSFVKNTSNYIYVFVGNISSNPSDIVFIPSDGISVSTGDDPNVEFKLFAAKKSGEKLVLNLNVFYNLPSNLLSGDGFFIQIPIPSSLTGNKTLRLGVSSNDSANPIFLYYFSFTITEPSEANPVIDVKYDSMSIQHQSSIDIGRFSKDSVSEISFYIYNNGTPSLIVPESGISVTSIYGNQELTEDPSDGSGFSLSFGENEIIKVSLDTTTLGQKSFVVLISSNDPEKNPFIFTVIYEISKAFNLQVKQSSIEVFDEDIVNLGSFSQKSIINKTITLENDGISYGVRVTSILAEGNLSLINIPALPFVLEPNNGNSVQFLAKFDSNTLGTRNASLRIQWEVSA